MPDFAGSLVRKGPEYDSETTLYELIDEGARRQVKSEG